MWSYDIMFKEVWSFKVLGVFVICYFGLRKKKFLVSIMYIYIYNVMVILGNYFGKILIL